MAKLVSRVLLLFFVVCIVADLLAVEGSRYRSSSRYRRTRRTSSGISSGSGGSIAGVVVGGVIFIGVVAFLLYIFRHKMCSSSSVSTVKPKEEPSPTDPVSNTCSSADPYGHIYKLPSYDTPDSDPTPLSPPPPYEDMYGPKYTAP